jgi:hypothetical protein
VDVFNTSLEATYYLRTTTTLHIWESKELQNPLNEDHWQAVNGFRTTGLLLYV